LNDVLRHLSDRLDQTLIDEPSDNEKYQHADGEKHEAPDQPGAIALSSIFASSSWLLWYTPSTSHSFSR
jgi:hypothetical protein